MNVNKSFGDMMAQWTILILFFVTLAVIVPFILALLVYWVCPGPEAQRTAVAGFLGLVDMILTVILMGIAAADITEKDKKNTAKAVDKKPTP